MHRLHPASCDAAHHATQAGGGQEDQRQKGKEIEREPDVDSEEDDGEDDGLYELR